MVLLFFIFLTAFFSTAFKTTVNLEKARLNYDVSGLQIGALEGGQSSRLGIPSWMTLKNVFSQSELVDLQVECRLDS